MCAAIAHIHGFHLLSSSSTSTSHSHTSITVSGYPLRAEAELRSTSQIVSGGLLFRSEGYPYIWKVIPNFFAALIPEQ